MSAPDWADALGLPAMPGGRERVIHKTDVVRNGRLTKTEEKRLKTVSSLYWYATVDNSTAQIAGVVNADYDARSVLYLRCEMRDSVGSSDVAQLLHGVFANPTVLLMEYPEGTVAVSACLRRKSKAEKGAFVTEASAYAGAFDASDAPWSDYLADTATPVLPQFDLVAYCRALVDRTRRARTIGALGFYPRCSDADTARLMSLVGDLNGKDATLNSLKEQRRSPDITFAQSTEIRMQMAQVQKDRAAVAEEIRELCHE